MVDLGSLNHKFTERELQILHHFMIYGLKQAAYSHVCPQQNMSEKTFKRKIWTFFAQDHIKQAIKLIEQEAIRQLNLRGTKMAIDAAWVLERAALLASFNIKKFLKIVDGQAYYDFSEATEDDWYCISEYTCEEVNRGSGDNLILADKIKIKTADKLRALELIGRHVSVQAFKDNVQQSGTVEHVTLSKEEYVAARREMLKDDDC